MPDGDRSLTGRIFLVAAAVVMAAVSAGAQPTLPVVSPAPAEPAFFSRSDFHLNAAWLGTPSAPAEDTAPGADKRFNWDTFWGGSLDFVDYVGGRVGLLIDYEAVLGSEYQLFDPNQGNYTLEASASARVDDEFEAVVLFHHVSRHLSDRPKVRNPVAYNELGGRLLYRSHFGSATLDVDAEAGWVTERAYVDYTSLADLQLLLRRPMTPRLGMFAHAAGHLIGVDTAVAGRTRTETGGLVEAGVHIKGSGGSMELFAGYEKRIDADPLDRQPQHWALAGFRLLSR
jgi:hypothetical protein